MTSVVSTKTLDRQEREAETPGLLQKYLEHIGRDKLLTHEEEIDLSKRVRAGDRRARQKLIERNLRLVVGLPEDPIVALPRLLVSEPRFVQA